MNALDPDLRLEVSPDVLIFPVRDLADNVRERIQAGEEDFVVSNPRTQTTSTIISPDAAALIRLLRGCSVRQAAARYAQDKGLDSDQVLASAGPVIRKLWVRGHLVAPDGAAAVSRRRLEPGEEFAGMRVRRALHILAETELYVVCVDGADAVLKMQTAGSESARTALEREVVALRHLGGAPAPRLIDEGTSAERRYVLMEWIPGVWIEAAAAEARELSRPPAELLALVRRLFEAYATLHDAGVRHGDVHGGNVLVDAAGEVRLLDFGLARRIDHEPQQPYRRGGFQLLFEPELAAALASGSPRPWPSAAGEQYACAGLAYRMMTGTDHIDFSLDQQAAYRQIVEEPPIPFAERGIEPWPELESVLARALSKEPAARYSSIRELIEDLPTNPSTRREAPATAAGADSLQDGGANTATGADSLPDGAVSGDNGRARFPASLEPTLSRFVDCVLERAAADGAWMRTPPGDVPARSVQYGDAGIALALHRIARVRGRRDLSPLADLWITRAVRHRASDGAFDAPSLGITRDRVGEVSPYHTPTGVYAVQALLGRAMRDGRAQILGLEGFLRAAEGRSKGWDVTLGRAGPLLVAALLRDALGGQGFLSTERLSAFGERWSAALREYTEQLPAIPEAPVNYYGIAHGWAGFLYAQMQWHRASGRPGADLPGELRRRLAELADLAEPAGCGLIWPHGPRERLAPKSRGYSSGWCHGNAGYVFLFGLAFELTGEERFLELATGAAHGAWEATHKRRDLCCGLIGRAYALLKLHKLTDERPWLDRAAALAHRVAVDPRFEPRYERALYRGSVGLGVLAAELEFPRAAAHPLFEDDGWPATPERRHEQA